MMEKRQKETLEAKKLFKKAITRRNMDNLSSTLSVQRRLMEVKPFEKKSDPILNESLFDKKAGGNMLGARKTTLIDTKLNMSQQDVDYQQD